MSEYSNIVTATFGGSNKTQTRALWRGDYGQILQFEGIELPAAYEVHFGLTPNNSGEAFTQIGNAEGVTIPDVLLAEGSTVYAWVFLHTGSDDGETVYYASIPVNSKPTVTDEEPTPEEQSVITQTIAALNNGVTRAESAADSAAGSATAAQNWAVDAERQADRANMQREQAQMFAGVAAQQMQQAAIKAQEAAASATAAADSATAADASETAAAQSAADAETSADRAEQAAKDAGYMYFYIDENGDLIYQRTSNTQVDFYLSDGDLYVRANG